MVSFGRRLYKGLDIILKSLINLLKKQTCPKNDLTSFIIFERSFMKTSRKCSTMSLKILSMHYVSILHFWRWVRNFILAINSLINNFSIPKSYNSDIVLLFVNYPLTLTLIYVIKYLCTPLNSLPSPTLTNLMHDLFIVLGTRGSEVGKRIILPASFTGGCIRYCKEIQKTLYDGQQAQDQLDLTLRVFMQKLQDLKDRKHLEYYDLVAKYMMHRRRKNRLTVEVCNAQLNNEYLVLYNLYLLSRYKCHINIDTFRIGDTNQNLENILRWDCVSKTMITKYFYMFSKESDLTVIECLNKVVTFQLARELRRLFAITLVYYALIDRNTRYNSIFIDRLGATRKIFLYRSLAHLRSKDIIVVTTATSRVVATIMRGGEQHIHHVDKLLKGIMGNNEDFGGKVIVFGNIKILEEMVMYNNEDSIQQLIRAIFPTLHKNTHLAYMKSQAILAAKKNQVDILSHTLELKTIFPIIFLRNLDHQIGCVKVKKKVWGEFKNNIIDTEIVFGKHTRKVFTPRILFLINNSKYWYLFAYFKFSHDQLYIALFR
ncbi:hypothetical protein Pfo_007976 [Paulownia fortunei]|nr:hypothetical protein Pfo_007976 [Paulownia fortunei]